MRKRERVRRESERGGVIDGERGGERERGKKRKGGREERWKEGERRTESVEYNSDGMREQEKEGGERERGRGVIDEEGGGRGAKDGRGGGPIPIFKQTLMLFEHLIFSKIY